MRCKVMIKTKIQFGEIIFNVSRQFFFAIIKTVSTAFIRSISRFLVVILAFSFFSCVFIPYVFLQNIPSVGFFLRECDLRNKGAKWLLRWPFFGETKSECYWIIVIIISSSNKRQEQPAHGILIRSKEVKQTEFHPLVRRFFGECVTPVCVVSMHINQ